MKRIALIVASTAAAVAATLAIAQPQPIPPAGGSERARPPHERTEQGRGEWRAQRAERMQARMNERLAKLRTDMNLKPEQVPLFDAVEKVLRTGAEKRREGWAAMREQRETFRHADIMEKLDLTSGRQAERAARTKELADAVRPLWATLSDQQKTTARRSVREAFSEGRGRMERMRERWQERRGGQDRDGDNHGQRRMRDRGQDDDRG